MSETVIGCGEPQLVVRAGVAYAARLTPAGRADGVGVARAPVGVAVGRGWWRDVGGSGGAGLARRRNWRPGRCGWRWPRSGVNFRDVLVALGMYPGAAELGAEGAGVVIEVGARGDRVGRR